MALATVVVAVTVRLTGGPQLASAGSDGRDTANSTSPAATTASAPATGTGSADAESELSQPSPTPSPQPTPVEQVDEAAQPPRVPESASGEFVVASTGVSPAVSGDAVTYVVQVERGLPFAPDEVSQIVDRVLTDPRGWPSGGHELTRVNELADASVHVMLASPQTADRLCAPLLTRGRLSCRVGQNVVLNGWRWANGFPGYRYIDRYRAYLINHEVGHALGYPHVACPAVGHAAPVMMQQTKGLNGCLPNPWPAAVDLG